MMSSKGADDTVSETQEATEHALGSRQVRAAETEAALKAAARRVFARQGYLNTKITDITAEAGRAAGSFYNHFPGKEAILEALIADVYADASLQVTEQGTEHNLADRAHLREHVATTWFSFKNHLPEITALAEAALVNEDLARRSREMRDHPLRMMREHLEDVQRAGYRLPGQPAVVASAIVSLLEQFCTIWLVQGHEDGEQPLADDEAIDTLTDFVLRGIVGMPPGK